jgi:hypothetical protein
MNHIDIIDEHSIIRETVGYEVLNQVPIEDMPKVMEFLKVVYNYNRMKRVVKEDEEPGWVDPMEELFDWEEATENYRKKAMKEIREEMKNEESEWQRRKRLEAMKEAKQKEESYTRSLKELARQKEEREEKELIKNILADPRNADGFADDEHKQPRYVYEGYTYILNLDLNRIIGVEVPREVVERKWLMDDLKEQDAAWERIKKNK